MYPKRDKDGCLIFPDHPEFRPNLTPREVILAGAWRGGYFRPIDSAVTGKSYKNQHHKYAFFKGIPEDKISRPLEEQDVKINKYGVNCGTSLLFWESKGWITKYDPYGWFAWYTEFYNGRRCPDDERQIKRWLALTGPKGRFKNRLIGMIHDAGAKYDDYSISPAIRQTLLHWGYELTKKDYDARIKLLSKTNKKK